MHAKIKYGPFWYVFASLLRLLAPLVWVKSKKCVKSYFEHILPFFLHWYFVNIVILIVKIKQSHKYYINIILSTLIYYFTFSQTWAIDEFRLTSVCPLLAQKARNYYYLWRVIYRYFNPFCRSHLFSPLLTHVASFMIHFVIVLAQNTGTAQVCSKHSIDVWVICFALDLAA